MKQKTLLTLLFLLIAGTASATLTSGYYRIISYNSKYLTENTSSNALICSDLIEGNYSQVWYLNISGTDVTIMNVLTGRYIKGQGNTSWQYTTDTSSTNFVLGEDGGVYTFKYDPYNFYAGGLHCDANLNVVQYDVAEAKSKWTVESATVEASALAAQQLASVEASTSDLLKVFTTTACTELKSGYTESDLTALPSSVQTMAAKIKDNTWATYSGWDKTEKTFRIADYNAYSSHERWTSILGLGHSFGRLTNPTGISVTAGDYIQVYVGVVPDGQSVTLEVAGQYQASGPTYTLKQGMNTLLMASSGNCFVRYEVDNTTDGIAPYTAIDSYTPVTVHIEGGIVNGYFDLTKGDDNDDWAKLQANLLQGTTVDIRTSNLLFHMTTSLVTAACPTNMVELLGEWDKILNMEHSLMGLEDFNGYWNNLLSVTDMSGQDYMHASTYGTYYDVGTIKDVMSYEELFAGGALWGPAHENGHIFQKYINMVGQTEVSNNVFSNVAVYNNGHLTSRASNISVTFENMANNVFWNDRDIWERTHLYFQLYQFFHILGNKSDFYPELFKALRSDPMVHTGGIFTSATDDYLKFYKKCCQVSGYDLTEFFQAYGFFVIPTMTSYTLNDVTKDAYKVEDYGNYYLTVTQDEINAAKQAVADMNLPKANIIFIEDRITAPDATYEGAPSGAKKTAFSEEFPIGQAGETGQYTEYGETCSAYTYNVTPLGRVKMVGTGAVGFIVYNNSGDIIGFYNTTTFNLPSGATSYTIKAAAGNGTCAEATLDTNIDIKDDVEDVTNIADNATDAVTTGTQITSESGITSGKAYVLKTGADRYITDNGTNFDVPNSANAATKASTYYLNSAGDGTWKIKNYFTGKYWGVPVYNEALTSAEEASAGAWSLNFSSNIAYPSAPDANNTTRGIDRSGGKVWGWETGTNNNHKVYIYEIAPSSTALSELTDKDISVSNIAAETIETGQWYVMFDRGANHGYLYENSSSHTLYNTTTVPSGYAPDNAKYLVRIVGEGGNYYLQTGLGNYFGEITQSTAVPTTALKEQLITIKKISDTDGHYYLASSAGRILDANACNAGDATVVGWNTIVPTATGGNNDWAFYPVELVDSWVPTISEVYTINNTNSNRGALIYNSDNAKYVWSSGKSGTFDASNANSQWVIIPTETSKQYYLYNVGAGKFAIPTAIAQGSDNSWIFSDNAVAVIFETQGDGTKKIKMATNPVSGTNAAYMAVSNNYTGPIINYNDVGGNFTIAKVDGQDQSTAANAAVAKLVKSQTALTSYPQASGWYVIQIKSKTGSASYAGRYMQNSTTLYTDLYPLTFTGAIDVQPAITDPTFFTHIDHTSWDNNNWQLPDGRFLVKNGSNKFPTPSATAGNVICGYDNGNYFKAEGNWFADPYNNNANYFIGETTSMRTAYTVYPIDLVAAGLTAWQVICDDAPETAQISCTRSDISGLTSVYKNGYIFLPTGVTPDGSDFMLDGAVNVSVDAENKVVTIEYNPNLAIVEAGVTVAQGYQTAGRDEEVMLLKINASPFKAATGVSLAVSLKDGSEANISKLTLYEASTNSPEILSAGNSGAPTKTIVAETNVSSSTVSLTIGSLSAGDHYYWLGATVKSDATLGAVLDAAVTSITYTCNSKETTLDLASVGDPADRGAMIFSVHNYPFLPRDNGSRVYRIPAMVVADDGSIVVACDKRYDSHTDVGNNHVIDIVIRRSADGGKTWSDPVVIAKGQGSSDTYKCGYGDPSLTKGKDGKLYCLFVAGNLGFGSAQKQVALSVSTDNGVTWSSNESTPPTDLYLSGKITDHASIYHTSANGEDVTCYGLCDYFVTSGQGICTPEGYLMYLLCAKPYTNSEKTAKTGNNHNFVFYSTDEGVTWHISDRPLFTGGDEAKLAQANDGSLIVSTRQSYNRGFNTATYTANGDGTLSFTPGTQYNNSQLSAGGYPNNQDIFYYQRETVTGKKDIIFHTMTTGQHANLKLYCSTDGGVNWTEFLNVQTKGTRYVTMDKSGTDENPGSLYLFFEDQSLNAAGGYTDYNHYPLNFVEITRDQLLQYIPYLDKSALEENVKIVYNMTGHTTYGSVSGNTWTSNASSGKAGLTLTKSDGEFNQYSNWNSHFNLAYKPAVANTPSTLTLTAPDGYIIKGYSLLAAKASSSAHTYTLTAADGTSVTPAFANSASGYTSFSKDDLNVTTTTISVTTTDVSQYIAIADFVVTLYPILNYTRSVTDGRWGTVCVPGAVAAANISGAEIYRIAGKVVDGESKPTELKLEEVENMEAGKPYLFLSNSNQLSLTYYGSTVVSTPRNENGLFGSFAGMDVAEGMYLLSNNTIVLCGTGCNIGANRAYINMDEVPVYSGGSGVKSLAIIFEDPDGIIPIDDEQLTIDNAAIYNLAGQMVNGKSVNGKLARGIYIVNGRKVVIK